MRSQKEKAQDFRGFHHGKRILILPNAWDVPSARVFENEGFPAVATSSAGLMVSLGYPDGEVMDRHEFVSVVKRIARVLSVPLSVDIVAGFGKTTKEVLTTVKAILKARRFHRILLVTSAVHMPRALAITTGRPRFVAIEVELLG